jgi:hypothetical protein
MPSPRHFPPPWTIEELNDACFVVSDSSGQKLAYVYFEEEPGRRSAAKLLPYRRSAAKQLTKDKARRDRYELCEVAGAAAVATALALRIEISSLNRVFLVASKKVAQC